MSALTDFSSLVATLYEAASDPEQWERFLDNFYRAMDGTHGALTAVAAKPECTKVVLQGYSDSEVRAYADYYSQCDVVVRAGLDTMKRQSQWIGPLEEILPYRELEASEIYNDHYRQMDMHYASCLMIGETGPYAALGLAAWRPRSSGPFRPEQLHLTELLAPHLKQAFQLHANLTSLRVEREAFHSTLDATAAAVLALRSDGRILTASLPAEAMLSRKEVLRRHDGRLHAVDPERNRILQHLIDCAARVGDLKLGDPAGTLVQPGGSLLLPMAGKPLALQVRVLPARSSRALTGVNPAVLVFIADPGAVPPSRARILQELYRLTPMESRLADLFLQGRELKEAAEELKLSYASTRFHLKQIFRKTNTTRQTELLRLLLAIPAQG